MDQPDAGAISLGRWFGALVTVSAALVIITFASYAVADHHWAGRILFWLGLGGENNIGAWWSGMLLALAAFLGFDGFFDRSKRPIEQRGWLALAFALLLLSFDEIASLHEYLSARGTKYLAVLGIIGLSLASYGMQQLQLARVPARTLWRLLLAFGLLATVPLHEMIQHRLQWQSPFIYGLRALLEEGTEIVAMLIFVSVTREAAAASLRATQDVFVALVGRPRRVILTTLSLWPVLTAATFELPQPGGPADWLACTLFMACALLGVRAGLRDGKFGTRLLALIAFYLAASAAANAMKFTWDPAIFAVSVNLRGVAFALLLITGVALLNANGRRLKASHALLVAAAIGVCSIVWHSSQLLWCGLPPVLALWLYWIERQAAAESRIARAAPSFQPEAATSR